MMMDFDPMRCKQGQIVGHVDLDALFGPIEVPVSPARWFILRVFPNRELKVMREFARRNVSAWLPMLTSPQEISRSEYRYGRRHDWVERRNVTAPLISGAVLLPDFEIEAERWRGVPGTLSELRFGDFVPTLTRQLMTDLRNIEAIGNTPKSKRAHYFEVGQLVRVINGPFRAFCGRVERFDSPGRLSVGVEIFGRITPTELGESDIETVKAGAAF